jgi:hypothetical protein
MNRDNHQGTKWKIPTTIKIRIPNIQNGILRIPITTFLIMNLSILIVLLATLIGD